MRHVGNTDEERRWVRWCNAAQYMVRQHCHFEGNSLWHMKPVETNDCITDVVKSSCEERGLHTLYLDVRAGSTCECIVNRLFVVLTVTES